MSGRILIAKSGANGTILFSTLGLVKNGVSNSMLLRTSQEELPKTETQLRIEVIPKA
jgi:hypothetical protein